MKNTLSNKIIAVVMAVIVIATLFTACGTKKNEASDSSVDNKGEQTVNGTAADTESKNEASDTNAATEENTSAANKTEATNTNDTTTTTALNSVITTTTKPNQNSTTTTKPSGNGKPITTTTTTTKVTVSSCNHSYGPWYTGVYDEKGKQIRERTCTKCGYVDTDYNYVYNPNDWLGNQSEYNELLRLVNKARKEAGVTELKYCPEFQSGANTRAIEITTCFSHTRPNGKPSSSVYNLDMSVWISAGENIFSGGNTPASAFNAWMNSPGHKANMLHPNARGFVCARCGSEWMMAVLIPADCA